MTEGTTAYFSADEFFICCAAAGVESLYGFAPPGGPPARRDVAQALFSLTGRGFLRSGEDGFALSPELLPSFRLMRESGTVVLAYQRRDGGRRPCRLLYGGGERFVSLVPGDRRQDYVGVEQYQDEAEWLRDAGLAPEEDLADDLAAQTEAEQGPALRGLARFAAGGPVPDRLPEEVFGYLESRRTADWRLEARALLVRQTLFDCIIAGEDGRAGNEVYRLDRLAEIVRDMRSGRRMLV